MSVETMASFLNFGPLFINETVEDKYKRKLIAKILKRDFEVLNKQIQISNILGEFSIYENPMDELEGIEISISLAFNKKIEHINEELKELLSEACTVLFFTKRNIEKYDWRGLSNKLSLLIYNTAIKLKGSLLKNAKDVFFEEFREIFPNEKIEFFERNYRDYIC